MEFSRACPDINFVDGGFGCGKVPRLSEYKNFFLRKNQTDHVRHLIWPEWKKGEIIPDNTAPKSYHLLIVENYNWDPQYEFGDQL